MKITAQEEYGLRCIMQLARSEGDGPVMVRDIAEREGLSVAYVEKLLWLLSRGGISESVRGPRGGYRLTRPCSEISIGEVMRVKETSSWRAWTWARAAATAASADRCWASRLS